HRPTLQYPSQLEAEGGGDGRADRELARRDGRRRRGRGGRRGRERLEPRRGDRRRLLVDRQDAGNRQARRGGDGRGLVLGVRRRFGERLAARRLGVAETERDAADVRRAVVDGRVEDG